MNWICEWQLARSPAAIFFADEDTKEGSAAYVEMRAPYFKAK
jgi:hypothetical protein